MEDDICPNCGAPIVGIVPDQICPECGYTYQDMEELWDEEDNQFIRDDEPEDFDEGDFEGD